MWVPSIGWHRWAGTHWERDDSAIILLACQTSGLIIREGAQHWDLAGRLRSTSDSKAGEAEAHAKALLGWGKKSAGKSRIEAMVGLARNFMRVEAKQLDSDPWKLNVQNGTLDLRTGALHPHNPIDFITRVAPVVYAPGQPTPWWDYFLARVLPDLETRAYLQRAIGYSLTGETSEQVLFFLSGGGDNGKTTFLKAIKSALGPYVARAPADFLTATEHGSERHPTDIMSIRGARLVICAETEKGRRWATQRVKELTGETEVTARLMRCNFETFRITGKLFVMANDKPTVKDQSHAFWRRMRVIPFDVRITEEEKADTAM